MTYKIKIECIDDNGYARTIHVKTRKGKPLKVVESDMEHVYGPVDTKLSVEQVITDTIKGYESGKLDHLFRG